jgi:hypothetical protein
MCKPENRFHIRNPRAVLDSANPALRDAAESRELYLRQPSLFAELAHTLTEQSSDRWSYRHWRAFTLTYRVSRYIIFTISKEHPTMLEPDVISRIRHIFLQPRPHVSIMQAEGLLGWTRKQMYEAIENGEVELWTTPLGKWFPRTEMMAKALEIWPMHVIEEALGDDADGVLPQAIRSAELRIRLPRHHIDMLEYRADQQETTVSGVLARELDGIASAHIEELSAALPGFAEAMAWPGD